MARAQWERESKPLGVSAPTLPLLEVGGRRARGSSHEGSRQAWHKQWLAAADN